MVNTQSPNLMFLTYGTCAHHLRGLPLKQYVQQSDLWMPDIHNEADILTVETMVN